MKLSYLCRTTRPSRAYKDPGNQNGEYIVLGGELMFIADHTQVIDTVMYYKIDQRLSTDVEFPIGYWVANDVVSVNEVENDSDDEDSTIIDTNEVLLVLRDNPTMYESQESTTPVTSTLKTGDKLYAAQRTIFVTGNKSETRYYIEATSANDNSVIGQWVPGDYVDNSIGFDIRYQGMVRSIGTYSIAAEPEDDLMALDDEADTGSSSTTAVNRTDKRELTIDGVEKTEAKAIQTVPVISTDGSTTVSATGETTDSVTTGNEDTILESIEDSYDYVESDVSEWVEQYGFYDVSNMSLMSVPIGRMIFVHGMPFQYTYLTDRRLDATAAYGKDSVPADGGAMKSNSAADMYGRVFAKEIASNMPIAVLVPGVPVFMTNVSQGLKGYKSNSSAVNYMMPLLDGLTDSELGSAIANMMNGGNGETYQYYGMQVDLVDFFNYLNAETQTAAKLMGIDDIVYAGQKCGNFNWADYNCSTEQDFSMFEDIIGISGGVSFAFDPLSSITDSLSNDTTDSQFAGMINNLKNQSSELEFLTGMSGIGVGLVDSTNYDEVTANLTKSGGLGAGISNAISRLKSLVSNASHGMNVRFPKIWSDSSSSKSYSIEMRFITPYSTAFCKWRYVLVPFLTAFTFAAPQSPSSIVNYKRPFLIRAFSKGYFNIEMGIASITWKRFGDGDMISGDGVPTQIDVTLDFEDLYHQLAISKFAGDTMGILPDLNNIAVFFNNTGLMDLIGTLSGVNMNRITLGERVALYASSTANAFSAIGGNFMRHIQQRVAGIADKFLYGT